MTPDHTSTRSDQARRQDKTLLWFAGFMLAAAVATVVVFNMAGGTLFDSTRYPASQTNTAQKPVAADATIPPPSSASDETPASTHTDADTVPTKAPVEKAASVAATAAPALKAAFAPPAADAIPDGPMGDVIRQGERIFINTRLNAPKFVGNSLNCVNCHLDAGRKADSAPMWGAYPLYPAYRSKTKHVDTFAARLRGCFVYSMNGTAPPFGDDVLVALEAYSYWMAKGAPTGEKLAGSGFHKLEKPAQEADGVRGRAVYEANCALCHGAESQGQRAGSTQVFPPLWGAQSYNWGAGMHSVATAAAFIKANMPLGKGGTLSDQDAWDVAWYIDSHERPQDPRFTGDVASTRAKFHDTQSSLYGTTVDGKLLGSQAY